MPVDRLSAELRSAEREIDRHYVQNVLTFEPFGCAGWHFLAFCEDWHFFSLSRERPLLEREYAALVDNLLNDAQWPLRWLTQTCATGGAIPRTYDETLYSAASERLELAGRYGNFVAAFTFASWGLATLTLNGHRIQSSSPMRSDARFEAYDRLIANAVPSTPPVLVDSAFVARIRSSVRVRGETFDYQLTPQIVRAGIDALSPLIDLRFRLPRGWRFSRFTLIQFQEVARVLWVLSAAHFQARVRAAELGCEALGLSGAVLVMKNDELFRRFRRYSGVSDDSLRAILETLTYGACGQSNPDPAMQPLIPLSREMVAISPSLLLNSSMERNFSVLLNRLPEERSIYSALSQEREVAMRDLLVADLSRPAFRFWHGSVPEWGAFSEVDFVVISDDERQCLVLELKSFIGPADPREVRERSVDIQRGVAQLHDRIRISQTHPGPLHSCLRIDASYEFTWAVVSESSIGAVYVQAADAPVVNARHLIARLRRSPELRACCLWLNSRAYLPIEGIDFEVLPVEDTIGNWTLEWYAIRLMTESYLDGDRSVTR